MTDSEINRTIAESLEPFDSLPIWREEHSWAESPDAPYWESGECGWYYSPMGCWARFFEKDPEPRNFLTDPAMRDLLQEKLLEDGFMITMAWLPDRQIGKLKRTNCVSMHLGKGIGSGEREFHIYDTRERIWALAWIRAHNLTADRLEG